MFKDVLFNWCNSAVAALGTFFPLGLKGLLTFQPKNAILLAIDSTKKDQRGQQGTNKKQKIPKSNKHIIFF